MGTDNFDRFLKDLGQREAEKLDLYADLIEKYNAKFNLTGHSTRDEIYRDLIEGSVIPLKNLRVPRGTRFADIGSGAGIPGIPLGILHPETSGLLIEARRKKADFITEAVSALGLSNIKVICGRAEDLAGSSECREVFDCAFSRALGGVFTVLELALPMVKVRGMFFIYSSVRYESVEHGVIDHADTLGGTLAEEELRREFPGMLVFKKIRSTPGKYPRRFAVIKREAAKYGLEQQDPDSGKP